MKKLDLKLLQKEFTSLTFQFPKYNSIMYDSSGDTPSVYGIDKINDGGSSG